MGGMRADFRRSTGNNKWLVVSWMGKAMHVHSDLLNEHPKCDEPLPEEFKSEFAEKYMLRS